MGDHYDIHNQRRFTARQAVKMDIAFCRAMCAAIKAGYEKVEIGRVVDRRPLMPAHFEREPIRSGMSSAGALCAEVADFATVRPGRFVP